MDIAIKAVGYNTEQIQHSHVINGCGVGLYVCGLKKNMERFPDGRIRTPDASFRRPALRLYFPGGVSEYEYENIRENWWIVFDDPAPIYYDFNSRQPMLRLNDQSIAIKPELPLSDEEIYSMRMAFNDIYTAWQSNTPQGKAAAELILGGVLAHFLKEELNWENASKADRYKNLIDSDSQWEFSLDELAQMLGMRRDVARRMFIEKYKVTPRQYRIRLRLAKIIELLSASDLSLKEIAYQCGLKNVTYLNSLSMKYFNCSPGELMKRLRKF